MAPCRPVNHLLFHEQTNFGNQKTIREIKRRNFGNQKIIREIKRTRQESKHIIILVILLEHRNFCRLNFKLHKKYRNLIFCLNFFLDAIEKFPPHYDLLLELCPMQRK